MDDVRAYLLSVCGAAILCAIANRFLTHKGSTAGIGKLLFGLFLTLTVMQPISSINFDEMENITFDMKSEALDAVHQGEENTREAMVEIIKSRTAAYILQKAHSLHIDVAVEVLVSHDSVPTPEKVYLTGSAAPFAKQQLQTIIEQDLGIAKEKQIWT